MSSNYQHWGTRSDGTAEPYDTSAVSVAANTTLPYAESGGNATIAPYGWASAQPNEKNQVMCRMQSGWQQLEFGVASARVDTARPAYPAICTLPQYSTFCESSQALHSADH